MTRATLPTAGEPIEVSTSDERSYTTWVDQCDGRYMRVFAPHDLLVVDLPGPGSVVVVRWHSPRGRHHVEAVFLERRGDGGLQWILEVEGDLRITQDRQFVRGAGGEPITLVRLDPEPVEDPEDDTPARPPAEVATGVVVDLSERGVRARFEVLDLEAEDLVTVDLTLDDTTLSIIGSVLRLFPGARGVPPEVVVVFDTEEATATRLRRYVLQSQLRARQAAAD
ncbi:PilZ domain-containing protein [Sanguibacter sp. 25GB23B1]|uniref:PilZ domain-containing protein n=1 Tax=unclassified Sanguibacter TaxID=2645534 RepID=UPI0032AEECC3